MIPHRIILIPALLGMAFTVPAWARPEYATREKQSCVTCHAMPWGGGPRNTYGKVYGTRGQTGSLTAGDDLYYGDLRGIGYWPLDRLSHRVNGAGSMQAAATANVPITKGEQADTRVVGTFQIDPLSGARLREGYIRYSPSSIAYFTLGHFYEPFGLLTDEHRTYVRTQTDSTINQYHAGLALSWFLAPSFRSDWVLVNDFQSGGDLNNAGWRLGAVLNLQWNPDAIPILLGTSFNYERFPDQPNPFALSLYGAWSMHRATDGRVPLSVLAEGVLAKNWNNPFVNAAQIHPNVQEFFQPVDLDPRSTSFGINATLKYDITPLWTPFYKFDYLALDAGRLGNSYTRNGFGIEFRIGPNVIINGRAEFATYPNGTAIDSFAAQNDFFTMFRVWI